jgi:tetratricopeptide (TPR) repeat protein
MNRLLYFIIFLLFSSCKNETTQQLTNGSAPITGDAEIDKLTIEIERDPLNAKLRYGRALKLYDKKMLDECIEDMRVAITIDSINPDYYHLVADAFLDNNLSSKALQSMEKVVKLYPERIVSLLKYAEFQHILRQSQAAILTCNEIIRLDPQNAEAYFMLGTILKDMGENQRAINSFQTATEMDEKLTDAWVSLGNLYAEKKDKKAIIYYQNAIDIDSKNPSAKQALAYFFQQNNNIDKAITVYEEIINAHPAYTDAYFNCGILLTEKKQFNQALEKFNILLGISPQDLEAYYYRGLIYKELKFYDKALSDFENANKISNGRDELKSLIEECKNLITRNAKK